MYVALFQARMRSLQIILSVLPCRETSRSPCKNYKVERPSRASQGPCPKINMPAVILQEFHEQPRSDQPQPPALSESSNAAATRNSSTTRRHTSHSSFARSALMNQRNSSISTSTAAEIPSDRLPTSQPRDQQPAVKFAQPNYSANGATAVDGSNELRPQPRYVNGRRFSKDGYVERSARQHPSQQRAPLRLRYTL